MDGHVTANDDVFQEPTDPLALSPELMQFVMLQFFTGVERAVKQYIRDVVIELQNEQEDLRMEQFKELSEIMTNNFAKILEEAQRPGGLLYDLHHKD